MESVEKLGSEHVKMLQDAQKSFHENSSARSVVGQHISKLGDQVVSIENAMKSIQNISLQVKILSLNASVEAARAGASGKGFSVVAEEIRRLSENTDIAANEISNAINTLNTLLKKTTDDMSNAQKIGAIFNKSLEDCVENAHNLSKCINGTYNELTNNQY